MQGYVRTVKVRIG